MAVSSSIHGGGPTVVIDERPRSELPGVLILLLLALFLPILIVLLLGQLLRLLGAFVIGLSRLLGELLCRVLDRAGPMGAVGAAIIRIILGIRMLDSDDPPPEPPSAPPAAPLPIPVPSTGPRRDGSDARAALIDLP